MAIDRQEQQTATAAGAAVPSAATLVAAFRDRTGMSRARRGLRAAGFADGQVVYLGRRGEQVDTGAGLSAEGRIIARSLSRWVGIGAAIGVAAGAAIGYLAWLALIGDADPWLEVVAGAVFGLVTGAVVGGLAAAGFRARPSALRRQHPEMGHWLLGVRAGGREERARAEAILRAHGPVLVESGAGAER